MILALKILILILVWFAVGATIVGVGIRVIDSKLHGEIEPDFDDPGQVFGLCALALFWPLVLAGAILVGFFVGLGWLCRLWMHKLYQAR